MECCICYEEYHQKLTCGHICCKECSNKINKCPICRQDLGKSEQKEEDVYRAVWVQENHLKLLDVHGMVYFDTYSMYDTIKDCGDILTPRVLCLNEQFIDKYRENRLKSDFNLLKEYKKMEEIQIKIAKALKMDDLLFNEETEDDVYFYLSQLDLLEEGEDTDTLSRQINFEGYGEIENDEIESVEENSSELSDLNSSDDEDIFEIFGMMNNIPPIEWGEMMEINTLDMYRRYLSKYLLQYSDNRIRITPEVSASPDEITSIQDENSPNDPIPNAPNIILMEGDSSMAMSSRLPRLPPGLSLSPDLSRNNRIPNYVLQNYSRDIFDSYECSRSIFLQNCYYLVDCYCCKDCSECRSSKHLEGWDNVKNYSAYNLIKRIFENVIEISKVIPNICELFGYMSKNPLEKYNHITFEICENGKATFFRKFLLNDELKSIDMGEDVDGIFITNDNITIKKNYKIFRELSMNFPELCHLFPDVKIINYLMVD